MGPDDFGSAFEGKEFTAFKACVCGSQFQLTDLPAKRCYSGVVNYDERLCVDCQQHTKGLARIVCLGCRRLNLFMEPQRAKTGFEFKRDGHYHIRTCRHCDPESVSASVLEHEEFCRQQKIITRKELDLVQEIEQRRLTFDQSKSKLEAELNSPTNNEDYTS